MIANKQRSSIAERSKVTIVVKANEIMRERSAASSSDIDIHERRINCSIADNLIDLLCATKERITRKTNEIIAIDEVCNVCFRVIY